MMKGEAQVGNHEDKPGGQSLDDAIVAAYADLNQKHQERFVELVLLLLSEQIGFDAPTV